MPFTVAYSQISQTDVSPDAEKGDTSTRSTQLNFKRRSIAFRVTILIGTFILLLSTFIFLKPRNNPSVPSDDGVHSPVELNPRLGWMTCGDTTHDALGAGCIFDPMLNSWVPSLCYNKTESDLKIDLWQHRWYKDQYSNEEIPLEEYRRGEYAGRSVYTSMTHHVTHCQYLWHSMFMAFTGQIEWITSDAMSQYHMMHCLDAMVEQGGVDKFYKGNILPVQIKLGYSGCRKVKWVDQKVFIPFDFHLR